MRRYIMINQDYDKLYDLQKKHKSPYLGDSKNETFAEPKDNANSGESMSVGAEGRNEHLKEK